MKSFKTGSSNGKDDVSSATLQNQEDTKKSLEHKYGSLGLEGSQAADLLLAESKALYKIAMKRIYILNAKAQWVMSLIIVTFGAVAIFANPSEIPLKGIGLVLGLVALAISFACALYAEYPRRTSNPIVSKYISSNMLNVKENAVRIKCDLASEWIYSASSINDDSDYKGRLLKIAVWGLAIGVALIVANDVYIKLNAKPISVVHFLLDHDSKSYKIEP